MRKITADRIHDGYRFLENMVLVIAEDGRVEGLVSTEEAGDDVEVYKGIISPGFINCHCHLELSHMRGKIPEGTGLIDFVFKVVTERHYSDEEIWAAIAEGEEEMLKNGIVAVGDICNNTLTLKQKEKGRISYYNFIESSGWLPSLAQARYERAKGLYDQYAAIKHNSVGWESSIVPHAPYSVSQDLWQQIKPYFKDRVVSIHNQETAFEDELFLQGTGDFIRMYQMMKMDYAHHQPTGKSSLQSYFPQLKDAENVILVHNTFTKQQDLDYLESQIGNLRSQIFFCLCVNANQYIEKAMPPIEMFRSNECNIVLGTDSLASNWSLNILDEIKTVRKHDPSIPLEEMLQWATINGAKALNMDDQLGSFEKGKEPGVIWIENEETLKPVRIK
jgi:cytosine/adenosine deaminase-related metal-dependent hydrolase